MAELIWDGKYDEHGKKRAPVRIELPFQTVETVNESVQERQRTLELSSSGNDPEWRNRLIWGDKKYVLPSLLPEFAGKVDLIYIDPPFDTGTDFSYTIAIPDSDEYLEKEPSVLELKAYRDTWGVSSEDRQRGVTSTDRYLRWLAQGAALLHELLADTGSLYVHLGINVSHYAKVALDEVFGPLNFVNEIVWKRQFAKSGAFEGINQYGRIHEAILFYSKGDNHTWNSQYMPYEQEYLDGFYKNVEPGSGRRFQLDNLTAPGMRKGDSGGPLLVNGEKIFLPPGRHWSLGLNAGETVQGAMDRLVKAGRIWHEPGKMPRYRRYLDEMPGLVLQDIWVDIRPLPAQGGERLNYDTQKPEALLNRIVKASSNENDLVLDCFCGSGTTAAVAEKLNRRWIACDLGRFAIHTTRKRLLGINGVKPFVVQNLGKYERQAWQVAEFAGSAEEHGENALRGRLEQSVGKGPFDSAAASRSRSSYSAQDDRLREQKEREAAYRRFILELYHATPVSGHVWLHGVKAGRMVHVGAVDAPITRADVNAIAAEVWRAAGKGANSPEKPAVDVLGWEFALDINETAKQVAAEARVDAGFKKIPREVLEKKAVEQGDVYCFELGALSVDSKIKKREVALTLSDFVIPSDDVPAEVRSAIKHWSQMVVINDEAHHTHDEDLNWNDIIRQLHEKTPLTAQLDFSATPRFQKGSIFPWTISDYPLKQAILDGIVKRPVKGIAKIEEPKSAHASVRYRGYLTAAIERWKEYREQLKALHKKPVLFIMMNSTEEADDVADWIAKAYPAEFGGGKTQIIHTDKSGEVSKKDLEAARKAVRGVDDPQNPIHGIVSVMMLREGWDVQNVTVVVGLRPYTAKANILPEQAIGRGLRLMFRDLTTDYTERVDIIGNQKFLEFVDDLEKFEELTFDTFEIGKDKLRILTIMPMEARKEFDIGLPVLSPILVRKKSLAEEIAGLDVMAFQTMLLPLTPDDPNTKTFRYEGHDIITLQKIVEREYRVPEPQTSQELIGYYARRIGEGVKLPSQFANLVPKVQEFFQEKAFGRWVDLNDPVTVRAMATQVASYVCIQEFTRVLKGLSIAEQEPKLEAPDRMLSSCQPFPWSRKVYEARQCVFNMVPCDNEFEKEFARFLDNAKDLSSFAKLPQPFGFSIDYTDAGMNLRSYYPDFVAIDSGGTHWLVETKGMETADVSHKDSAAANWCENATLLTGTAWKYAKIPQKAFEVLQPARFSDLAALSERR